MLLSGWLKKHGDVRKGDPAAALAKKVGISLTSMDRIVKGNQWPRPEVIRKITKATKGEVTANDLLAGMKR